MMIEPEKIHPKARQVHELSQKGMTAQLIAPLVGLTGQEVRRIKLGLYQPVKYMEWLNMEKRRLAEDKKEQEIWDRAKPRKNAFEPEEIEACNLSKAFKPVDVKAILC